jgi:hypothetical protein
MQVARDSTKAAQALLIASLQCSTQRGTTVNQKDQQYIHEPLEIERFVNGFCYDLPSLSFGVPNTDTAVAEKDDVFIKKPSPRGADYHRNFIYEKDLRAYGTDYWRGDSPVRSCTEAEASHNLEDALNQYPDLKSTLDSYRNWHAYLSPEEFRVILHYLVLHRMQYERLVVLGSIGIPRARFVFLHDVETKKALFSRKVTVEHSVTPAIVQERIDGISLWNMYSSYIQDIVPEWQERMPAIAAELRRIINMNDFDWNPNNFLYREKDSRLFYIDSKPTIFAGRVNNDHNLQLFKRFFLDNRWSV